MSSRQSELHRLSFRLAEPLRAGMGAGVGVAVTGLVAKLLATGAWSSTPLLVAPIGASAVLAFALPASPLAQPRAVIGGNVISCIVGVTAALLIGQPALAAAAAVAAAIMVMSLTRTLHPPGGALALAAALAGAGSGLHAYTQALVPAILCSVLLAAAATAYARLTGHSYPHRAPGRAAPPAVSAAGATMEFTDEDLDAALAEYGDALDVSREDLQALFRAVERQARQRRRSRQGGDVVVAALPRKAA